MFDKNNSLRYLDPDGRQTDAIANAFEMVKSAAGTGNPVIEGAAALAFAGTVLLVAGRIDVEGMLEAAAAQASHVTAVTTTAIAATAAAAATTKASIMRIGLDRIGVTGTPSGPLPEPPDGRSVRDILKGVGLGILKTLKLPKGSGLSMDELLSKSMPELEEMAKGASGPARAAIQKIMKLAKQSARITSKGGDLAIAPGGPAKPSAPQSS